jgi:uncharacterized protein DUF3473
MIATAFRTHPGGPIRLKLDGQLELIEFPISTVKAYGVICTIAGGGYFRLLPYAATAAGIRGLNRKDGLPVVCYLRPREFDPDQPVQAVGVLSRFLHYVNLHKTARVLNGCWRTSSLHPWLKWRPLSGSHR